MTFDLPVALITVVFASQILVCSFISAWRFSRTARLLDDKYPPLEYPKLYPIAPATIQRHHNLRMAIRLAVGVAAVALLVIDLARGIGAGPMAFHMICVAMAQMLPVILYLPQQIAVTRALRAMPAPAVRSADLRQWRVSDFVSRTSITLGIAGSILSLACSAWFYFHAPAPHLLILAISSAMSALLLGRMLYVLLTPVVMARPDPYMTAADVFRARQQRLRLLFRAAFTMGVYFVFMQMYAARLLRFEYFYVAAVVSILVQLLSLRMTQMLQSAITERDLSPYRAEPEKETV